MQLKPGRLTLARPDDWHLHLRDGAAMRDIVAHSARQFARAIVMPNLRPPIVVRPPVTVPFDGPFYVGIGFCPHLADTVDAGSFSDVVLENTAGAVR